MATTSATPDFAFTAQLAPFSPAALLRFMVIQSAIAEAEAAQVRSIALKLSPLALRAWLLSLAAVSIPESIRRVRRMLAVLGQEAA